MTRKIKPVQFQDTKTAHRALSSQLPFDQTTEVRFLVVGEGDDHHHLAGYETLEEAQAARQEWFNPQDCQIVRKVTTTFYEIVK